MKVEIECLNCNQLFLTDYKHRDKKFCNRSCYFTYAKKNNSIGRDKDPEVREERSCIQCGDTFNERKKYKRKICSDECRLKWNSNPENIKKRLKKSKDSLIQKYGVDSFFKTENYKDIVKETFIKKYGVPSPMYVTEFVDKLKATFRSNHLKNLIPKLKEQNLTLISDYNCNKFKNTSQPYDFKCEVCDNIFTSTLLGSGKIPICRKCNPIHKNSKLGQIIKDFLNLNNIKHVDNCRNILGGREIDILLPEHNIGIEVNGNYFHSELSGGKSKNYHIDKTTDCQKKGIKLIQLYEDEILIKPDIVFSILSNKININRSNRVYARECEIREINKKDSTKFLNENHLQGNTVDKHRYGLFFKDELVSIITFGLKRNSLGNRNTDNTTYELVRFCNKNNYSVIGGFSKLLNHFIKTHNPSKIETFSDIRISGINHEDTVYFKNNFKFVKKTPPNYWYINTERYLNRYHRFVFRKDVLVSEGYDKKMTEWEIMKLKGYDRIWDCGSLKFEFVIQ